MIAATAASALALYAGDASKLEAQRPGPSIAAAVNKTGNTTVPGQCLDHGGCYPLMYVLGAQKSGTTSMFDQMVDQGACGYGSGNGKEAHFFDTKWRPNTDPTKYIKQYGGGHNHRCEGNLYLDATPDYIRHWFAPQRMKDMIPVQLQPKIKMLIMLREPIARDLSYYNHMLSNHMTGFQKMSAGSAESMCSESFLSYAEEPDTAPTYTEYVECELAIWNQCVEDAKKTPDATSYETCQNLKREQKGGETDLTFLTSGMYSEQIERWKASWPRHQMLVVQMEDLLQNTQERFSTIYKFFDFPAPPVSVLPNNNVQDYDFTVTEIDCPTKNKLKEIYEPYNRRLYRMLKEDQAKGGGAPDMEPKFPQWDDVTSVKCTPESMKRPHASKKDYTLLAKAVSDKVLALQPADLN